MVSNKIKITVVIGTLASIITIITFIFDKPNLKSIVSDNEIDNTMIEKETLSENTPRKVKPTIYIESKYPNDWLYVTYYDEKKIIASEQGITEMVLSPDSTRIAFISGFNKKLNIININGDLHHTFELKSYCPVYGFHLCEIKNISFKSLCNLLIYFAPIHAADSCSTFSGFKVYDEGLYELIIDENNNITNILSLK